MSSSPLFSIIYSDAFLNEREEVAYNNGETLKEAIESKYNKKALDHYDVRVSFVGEDNLVSSVNSDLLGYIKPKRGLYTTYIQPKDSDTARTALTIALIAGGNALFPGLGTAASIALTVGASYLSAAIIPFDTPDEQKTNATESAAATISGQTNTASDGASVEYLIGTMKIYPSLAGQPITEVTNKTDQYLTQAFCLGYKPMNFDIDQIKIGDTLLTEYEDYELEVDNGYNAQSDLTLIKGDVEQLSVTANFIDTNDQAVRTTAENTERIDVEIGYSALVDYNSNGTRISTSCQYQIEYKKTSEGDSAYTGINGTVDFDSVTCVSGSSTVTIKNGETRNSENQRYTKVTVYQSYLEYGGSLPSYVFTGATVYVNGTKNNNGSYTVLSTSGTKAFVSNYSIETVNTTTERVVTEGKTLTNESGGVTYNSASASNVITDTDSTSVATYRTHSITNIEKGQYDVRITRITAAPDSNSNISNEFQWTKLKSTQLTDDDGASLNPFDDRYAYALLRIKASDQLNGTIDNFNVIASSVAYAYDETDEDFTGEDKSGNPAYEYLKILTDENAAKSPKDLDGIDIDSFLDWADLCDEDVNGEPRFVVNHYVDYTTTAAELMRKIATVGRASRRLVDFKESILVDQADIEPISYHLSPASIKSFTWEKTFVKKPDAYEISFINEEKDYISDVIVVQRDDDDAEEDLENIEKLDGTGITNPDQVYRFGKYAHAQAVYRPETYQAEIGITDISFLRGDVVKLTHDRVQGVTCFGSVLAVSGLVVTVDNPFNISNDDLPLYATFSDPDTNQSTVETFEINDVTGSELTFSSLPTFALTGTEGQSFYSSQYAIGSEVNSLTRLYLIKSIEKQSEDGSILTLVDYGSPDIFEDEDAIGDYVTGSVILSESKNTPPTDPVIESLATDESAIVISSDGSLSIRALFEFESFTSVGDIPDPATVDIRYRVSGTNGDFLRQTFDIGEAVSVSGLEESELYDFKVRYVSRFGVPSGYVEELDVEIIGKTTPPVDVSSIDYDGGFVSWSYPNPEIDFKGFQVRYASGSYVEWESASKLHDGFITDTNYDVSEFTISSNKFFVKAFDTSDNESVNAATVIVNLGDYDSSNIVTEINKYDDGWPDTITNGFVDGGTGFLCSETTTFYQDDNEPFYNSNEGSLFYEIKNVEMTYEFSFTPESEDKGDSLAIEFLSTVDGSYIEYIPPDNSIFYSQTSSDALYQNDDVLFFNQTSGEYETFSGVVSSLLIAEYKFRVTVPANTSEESCLEYVKIIVDVDDIEQKVDNFTVSGGSARLPLTKSFREILNIQITLQDDSGAAVTAKIIDKNNLSGPLIETYDSLGVLDETSVDAVIRGY